MLAMCIVSIILSAVALIVCVKQRKRITQLEDLASEAIRRADIVKWEFGNIKEAFKLLHDSCESNKKPAHRIGKKRSSGGKKGRCVKKQ